MRFATLDLVRSDWRRYTLTLDDEPNNDGDTDTEFTVGVVGLQQNDGNYVLPPGVVLEQLNNNNNIINNYTNNNNIMKKKKKKTKKTHTNNKRKTKKNTTK